MKFLGFVVCMVLVSSQMPGYGQTSKKLLLQVDSLKALLTRADTLSPFASENMFDSISAVNDEISIRLGKILITPAATKINLDSALQHPGLSFARSKDKRLWIFSWYENTGGSFHSYSNVVHYRTASTRPKVSQRRSASDEDLDPGSIEDGLHSIGFAYDTIYKLRSKEKNLYLCIGSAKTCNSCVGWVAVVVELTKDSIRFDYPAFQNSEENVQKYISDFHLGARIGSIKYFKFDPNTQTLSFRYTTDDFTPVQSEEEKVITRKLKFNGKRFVGNGYQ